MSAGTLIVGAGQAGVQVAASMRELGYDEPITIVGAEPHMPYSRPPLSKALLAGDAGVAEIELRTGEYYRDQQIDVIPSLDIVEIDRDSTGAGVATAAGGRAIRFERLALATGARPRRLPVPGAELGGVLYLRSVDDALHLRDALAGATRVVVIGGGFIGLEAASVARKAGKDVVVIEGLERLVSRSVAPLVSQYLVDVHRRHGVDVRLGTGVTALHGESGRVSAVELADGTRIDADVVIVGIGIIPNTSLAERLGLECDRGIVVDLSARTSDPRIVAAGDCTVMPNPLTGIGRYGLESTQNASSQARTAAASLLGESSPQTAAPWFWSDQYDFKLQIAGLSDGYDSFVVRGDPSDDAFSVLYYGRDRLLAVDAVGRAADYLAVRAALDRGVHIDAEAARDPATPLKSLLAARAPAPSGAER